MTWSKRTVPPWSLASSRAIAAAWLAEAEKSCGTRMVFQLMQRACYIFWRAEVCRRRGSHRHVEHALDRAQGTHPDGLGDLDLRREIAQREVELLERVLPHVGAEVASAALVVGRRGDQRLG